MHACQRQTKIVKLVESSLDKQSNNLNCMLNKRTVKHQGMCLFCCQNYWNNRKAKAEQNAGIIGANLSKIYLISYNSYA